MFENKCHDEIHDDGRTYRKKGEINKIHSNTSRSNAKFAPPPITYSERTLLEPVYDVADERNLDHILIIASNLRKEKNIAVIIFIAKDIFCHNPKCFTENQGTIRSTFSFGNL